MRVDGEGAQCAHRAGSAHVRADEDDIDEEWQRARLDDVHTGKRPAAERRKRKRRVRLAVVCASM